MGQTTHEQNIVEARRKLSDLKNAYCSDLQRYIASAQSETSQRRAAALACQKSGCDYFNYAEEFVGNSDLLGAHRSALWTQGFAEDCAEILRSLPDHVSFLKAAFDKAGICIVDGKVTPGRTAYANMQRMVVKYLTAEESKKVKRELEDANLPIYGFDNEAKETMSKDLQIKFAFLFGVVFIVVMLAIALLRPEPTSFQYDIFKTVLALAGAGIAAVIPGFIEVKFKTWLRAGGALAVFVILFFFTPARLLEKSPERLSTPIPSNADRNHK